MCFLWFDLFNLIVVTNVILEVAPFLLESVVAGFDNPLGRRSLPRRLGGPLTKGGEAYLVSFTPPSL